MKKIIPFLIIITSILTIAKLSLVFFNSGKNPAYYPDLRKTLEPLGGEIKAPILVYHHIRPVKPGDYNSVSPEVFTAQMNWLKDNGYRVIFYSRFYEALTSTSSLPEKSVVISFDDGYLDQYENAYPILKKFGYPAIFFLNYNTVNWWGYLKRGMIEELLKNKMEIGSHGLRHKNLTTLDSEDLAAEVRQGKLKLEYFLTAPVYFFAYPNGEFNDQVADEVARAGFWSAVSDRGSAIHQRKNGPFAVSRVSVDNSLESFINLFK